MNFSRMLQVLGNRLRRQEHYCAPHNSVRSCVPEYPIFRRKHASQKHTENRCHCVLRHPFSIPTEILRYKFKNGAPHSVAWHRAMCLTPKGMSNPQINKFISMFFHWNNKIGYSMSTTVKMWMASFRTFIATIMCSRSSQSWTPQQKCNQFRVTWLLKIICTKLAASCLN